MNEFRFVGAQEETALGSGLRRCTGQVLEDELEERDGWRWGVKLLRFTFTEKGRNQGADSEP